MSYIADMYGKQSPDFVKGFLAAMATYAVWKDGTQTIGAPEKALRKEMTEAVGDLSECPEDFTQTIENYT